MSVMAQQNFRAKDVVVKVRKIGVFPVVSIKHATGWCIGLNCNFVVTNYHVAAYMGPSLKINGERVTETQFATSAQDDGAVPIRTVFGMLRYTPVRDVALLHLNHPLARKGKHGPVFCGRELQEGEPVNVYTAPGVGRLKASSGRFLRELSDGVLEFQIDPHKKLRPGVSGGLILNRQNQAVALLWGIADGNIAVGVPIWSLADFVKRVQPELAARVFPKNPYRPGVLSPMAEGPENDLVISIVRPMSLASALPEHYLRFELDEPVPQIFRASTLQHRTEESVEIRTLRASAQHMADGMRNFIAKQTLRLGGDKSAEITWQHEVRVVDGHQTFRSLSPGGKEENTLPFAVGDGVVIGDDWSTLPRLVGTNLKLRIQQDPDRIVEGRKLKVFRYDASVEDAACKITSRDDFFLFPRDHTETVACDGFVWTDENLHILRITQHMFLAPVASKLVARNLNLAVLYGWLGDDLLPSSIWEESTFHDGKLYWCEGTFSDYQKFQSSVRLLSAEPVADSR